MLHPWAEARLFGGAVAHLLVTEVRHAEADRVLDRVLGERGAEALCKSFGSLSPFSGVVPELPHSRPDTSIKCRPDAVRLPHVFPARGIVRRVLVLQRLSML